MEYRGVSGNMPEKNSTHRKDVQILLGERLCVRLSSIPQTSTRGMRTGVTASDGKYRMTEPQPVGNG